VTDIAWPALREPYLAALQESVDYVTSRYAATGIIAAGTILRGGCDTNSDLDIVVIHSAPFRQRVQREFLQVPAEIFVNSPDRIRRCFRDELSDARPVMAHMIATGHVLVNRDRVVDELRSEAKALIDAGPRADPAGLNRLRYSAATKYEDARDRHRADPATAHLILLHAIAEMLRYRVRSAGRFIPREKDLLAEVAQVDEESAMLARLVLASGAGSTAWAKAALLAERSIHADGFYEWESEAQTDD
jgi:hypothetical protein